MYEGGVFYLLLQALNSIVSAHQLLMLPLFKSDFVLQESPDSDVSSRTRSRGIASASRGRGRGRGQTRGRGSTPRVRGGAGRSGTPRVRGGQGRGSTPRVRGQAGRGRGSAENDRLVDLQEQRRQSMRVRFSKYSTD